MAPGSDAGRRSVKSSFCGTITTSATDVDCSLLTFASTVTKFKYDFATTGSNAKLSCTRGWRDHRISRWRRARAPFKTEKLYLCTRVVDDVEQRVISSISTRRPEDLVRQCKDRALSPNHPRLFAVAAACRHRNRPDPPEGARPPPLKSRTDDLGDEASSRPATRRSKHAEGLHRQAIVIDTHDDIPSVLYAGGMDIADKEPVDEHGPRPMKSGGLTGLFFHLRRVRSGEGAPSPEAAPPRRAPT